MIDTEQMHQLAIDAAKEAVHGYRQSLLKDQLDRAKRVVRMYASHDGGSGTITLKPRTNNTIRVHTLLAVVGKTSGTITITLGKDQLIFPTDPPGGYLWFNELDIFLSQGDTISLTIATPGNALFFGVWGEEVGDALAIA